MRKPITSRRPTPQLRVVGAARETTRHRAAFKFAAMNEVIEVWTYEEFAKLPIWERPGKKNFGHIPGIGYAALRLPESDTEIEDIWDVQAQCEAEREMMAGEA